jgi:hypothetical protein
LLIYQKSTINILVFAGAYLLDHPILVVLLLSAAFWLLVA